MALANPTNGTLLFFCFLFSSIVMCALCRPDPGGVFSHSSFPPLKRGSQSPSITNEEGSWRWRDASGRRLLIGSTAPICTYNECRGCRFKCSAEQVPVDAGDPMNSAYHYRCVCHR
ncbi:unnamed protein product [Musa acuminata subsp. burmannicoides]|uniref:(wild Malaysian banana) hypothetical protein n=1 Tax=Musa acuminata subsp. malaccensis TaxID=214687 RepID=A0A804LBQ6_MUSAM|nr:PREDICTED: uncharacterized protein LOC103972512 [Musa acuminata subsp. malaccensis]CAG1865618.1 unnamed protein product [Musa acuminata subsp. malaccensis]